MTINVKNGHYGRNFHVVHDAGDITRFKGVETSEGLACPLILGSTMLAHTLEMPAGLVVPEHPETEESMVYTLSGNWILIVDGLRHPMGPGSLHWLNEGAIAGCEVPGDAPALVLAFMRVKNNEEKRRATIDASGLYVSIKNAYDA